MKTSTTYFLNWDHRPALLAGDVAVAMLTPTGPWVSVDRDDVWYTAGVMSEAAWRAYFFGKEHMPTKTTSRLAKRLLAGLSREGLAWGRWCEYRHGHPTLSDDEIQLLWDAEEKKGYPVRDLEEARAVLSDNIWVLRPSGKPRI